MEAALVSHLVTKSPITGSTELKEVMLRKTVTFLCVNKARRVLEAALKAALENVLNNLSNVISQSGEETSLEGY